MDTHLGLRGARRRAKNEVVEYAREGTVELTPYASTSSGCMIRVAAIHADPGDDVPLSSDRADFVIDGNRLVQVDGAMPFTLRREGTAPRRRHR